MTTDDLKRSVCVRHLLTCGEVERAYQRDLAVFGDTGLRLETVIDWWTAYPDGLFGLFREGELSGCLGIWPITTEFFQNLASGSLREDEMRQHHIRFGGDPTSPAHWYVSGLNFGGRHKLKVAELLRGALLQWISAIPPDRSLIVAALAYTRDGARLLRRFDFSLLRNAANMADQHDLYVCSAPTPQAFARTLKARLPRRLFRGTDGAARPA